MTLKYCKNCEKVCEHIYEQKVENNSTYTYSKCKNCNHEIKIYGKPVFNHETQKWRR